MTVALALLAAQTATPIGTSHLGSTLLALLAVLALIITLALLYKRLAGNPLYNQSQLKIITHLNLGQRERLVVVEVGNQHVLLGITSQHISCLHTLPEPLLESSISSPSIFPKFSQFMQKNWSKNTHKAA